VRSPFRNPHTRIAAIYAFFREPEKEYKKIQINYLEYFSLIWEETFLKWRHDYCKVFFLNKTIFVYIVFSILFLETLK